MTNTRDIPYIIKVASNVVKNVLDVRNAAKIDQLKETSGDMYEQTVAYINEMISDAQDISQVIVDIFADALRDAGYDLPASRDIINPEIQQAVEKELRKCITILPYYSSES